MLTCNSAEYTLAALIIRCGEKQRAYGKAESVRRNPQDTTPPPCLVLALSPSHFGAINLQKQKVYRSHRKPAPSEYVHEPQVNVKYKASVCMMGFRRMTPFVFCRCPFSKEGGCVFWFCFPEPRFLSRSIYRGKSCIHQRM